MQRHLVALRCPPCRTGRPHAVTDLGNVFASAACTVCGETARPRTDVLVDREVLAEWETLVRRYAADGQPARVTTAGR